MPLDLLVPHLLLASDAPAELRALRLPALEKWIARGNGQSHGARSAEAWLAAEHDLREPVPFASVSLAADMPEQDGDWLRADPVHLRIEGDALRLHAVTAADLELDEARALAAALQEHFRGDGLEFHVAAADRWYVRVPSGESPRTTPLEEALGRNVFGLLPVGRGRINWGAAITEAQMVLSAHGLAEIRERAGRRAINSVWFWGEGPRPQALARRYVSMHADDAFARGLGLLSGASVSDAPQSLADVSTARGSDRALAVASRLAAAIDRGDLEAWKDAALALDRDWFAQLAHAASRFGSARIVLTGASGTRLCTVTPGSRWRWFRRARAVSAHG